MRYEYYFCKRYNPKLIEFLEEQKLRYKIDNCIGDGLIIFSLWSNWINIDFILNELEKMNVKEPIISVEFTNTEIKNAKLLVITKRKQSIDILNTETAYRYSCCWTSSFGIEKAKHKKQVETFVIGKEPSLKTSTALWSEDAGIAELFTDKRVVELVKNNSLRGIKFEKVLNKKGVCSENIFQIKSPNILSNECICFGYGEQKHLCHICGKEQFFIDNAYQLHLDFSKINVQSDLYMTERIWGEGIAFPLYIISQRFYSLLKENKLDCGIKVTPVAEVNTGDGSQNTGDGSLC